MSPPLALPVPARDAAEPRFPLPFSVCTLVTDWAQYAAMAASFAARGFGPETTEYLYIDNSRGNAFDAYAGLACMLGQAQGRWVVLCHQDVVLLVDDAASLQARLEELDRMAPGWALAGNAGGLPNGDTAIRISDPYGEDTRRGSFPARAVALDENFIVVNRLAPVGLSADVGGFHLYGPDLCMQAELAGRSAWVIDFHLRHLSGGKVDQHFCDVQARWQAKYARLFGRRWRIRTNATWLILPRGLDRLRAWWQMRKRRRKAQRRYG